MKLKAITLTILLALVALTGLAQKNNSRPQSAWKPNRNETGGSVSKISIKYPLSGVIWINKVKIIPFRSYKGK